MSGVLLGADLGTSGLKLVALDEAGSVVAETEAGYQVHHPAPDRAEGDVGEWRAAFGDALAALLPQLGGAPVRAVGLSGQMHGAVLVDAAGAALRPALLWPDRRATAEVARWRELPTPDRAGLANPLVPGMTGPMAAWLARHEPGAVDAAAALLLPKDALRAALLPGTDPRVTDRSDASATLLWDVVADHWSAAAVEAAGISPSMLPVVRASTDVAGVLTGPLEGVPVVVGGADTPLALLALGPADGIVVNLGTGAQVLRPGAPPQPADDPPVHTYADVDGGWYAMAALQNAGSAWQWVCDVLGLSWADLFAAAAAAPSGAGGVVFRPFLTGERGGVAGPDDRGGWTGLSAGTTRAELARAAVEGVVFAIASAAALLDVPDGLVLLSGGGARSALVPQLLADVLDRPVRPVWLRSASAVGAALLAARGAGLEVAPAGPSGAELAPRSEPLLTGAYAEWTETR
ncbi:FGGY family carbohydrate kinase [Blastococcus jejuensis]|uniref:FGGY family carbohydrate kinase n=1 Tax=Blastococcus jejuensis TaxID=351224 RepID=A0ABP6NMT7_9ACTN